jgi:ribosomal protein S18 acetylase RimI-like enzyme
MVRIETVTEATPELAEALAKLLVQLNPSIRPPDAERMRKLLADTAVTLFAARDDGKIVGTATVIVYTSPAWTKARIEDVVVDADARGRGIGEALVNACIEHARKHEATLVELQSRQSRLQANRLYQRMGFELRDSNVYRLALR